MGNLFRACPKCAKKWYDHREWCSDTKRLGVETINQGYFDYAISMRREFRIKLELRQHECGGVMSNTGSVRSEVLARDKKLERQEKKQKEMAA